MDGAGPPPSRGEGRVFIQGWNCPQVFFVIFSIPPLFNWSDAVYSNNHPLLGSPESPIHNSFGLADALVHEISSYYLCEIRPAIPPVFSSRRI